MVLPLLQLLTALTGASISNIKMSIYLNNQGLKKIKAVSANINNQLKTIKAVYTNVNGTIHKVWPYYAFDNGTFKGEFAGGVITNVAAEPDSGNYSWYHPDYMNNLPDNNTPNAITTGGLYRNIDNPHGAQAPIDTISEPFGFISASTINFSKYSKVRIAGKIKYTFTALNYMAVKLYFDTGLVVMPVYRNTSVGGTRRYIYRHSNVIKKNVARWWDVKTNEGQTLNSGDLPFDETFDISGWTTTDNIAILFDPDPGTSGSYSDFQREKLDMSISIIEFS